MYTPSRRDVLRLGATGAAASLAGCAGVGYGIRAEIAARRDDRVEWSTQVGVPMALSIADETLFVGTNESIAAVDPTSGEQRWRESLPKQEGRICYGPPLLVEDGRIYISGCRGTFAFDYDGTRLWHSNEPARVSGFATTADRLYGAQGRGLYALDRDTGEVAFSELIDQSQNVDAAGPTRGAEWFYYAMSGYNSEDIRLVAVDLATAEIQWDLDLGRLRLDHAPTYADGMLYVASAGRENGESGYGVNRLYAIDAASRTIEWEVGTQAVYESPIVTSDRIVFSSADREDTYVRAVGRDSGEELWTRRFGDLRDKISKVRVRGETVFAVLDSQEIVALDLADGSERWRFAKAGHVDALPVVYDDRVLVPTGDRVWALDRDALA